MMSRLAPACLVLDAGGGCRKPNTPTLTHTQTQEHDG